jgi:hypothetical protein
MHKPLRVSELSYVLKSKILSAPVLKMRLLSLPDSKKCKEYFTIGKEYEILAMFGMNGVVVLNDSGDRSAVLSARFESIT